MENWIDINSYAKKYGISQSTLRRRIRSNSITFKLVKGKYLLNDSSELLKDAPLFARNTNGVNTIITQKAPSNHKTEKEFETLRKENRKLKSYIEELETLVRVLEDQ